MQSLEVMAARSFDRINSLEKSNTDWRIKVRVTRMWATVSPDSGTVKGFNLILLDDDNAHVHSFSYANVWNVIGKDVVEGGVYIVQNFIVRDAVGNLKPVSSDICIRFTNASTFEPCLDELIIPRHKFEFFDLGDLFAEASRLPGNANPEFAVDLIGVVEEFHKVTKIPTKFGLRDIVRFKICDASNRHRVGVWGDLAVVTNEEYLKLEKQKDVIVILTSTKLTTYQESVQISTLPSSKVYFNLNDESVTEMRIRLEEEGYKPSQSHDDQGADLTTNKEHQKMSLQELNEDIASKVEKAFVSKFTILNLEDGTEWYFLACSKCQLEVFTVANRFKCGKCTRSTPVADKRFRINVKASDSTFNCSVVLMDRVVKQIIGYNASKLYQEQSKDDRASKVLPHVLHNICGKEITVNVEVIKVKNGEDGFQIVAEDMYDICSPTTSNTESSPYLQYPSIDLTESFDNAETSNTPGSAKSVNKKIKKEK